MNELPVEVLRCQVDSLRDALVKVLDTREKEARAYLTYETALNNYSADATSTKRRRWAARRRCGTRKPPRPKHSGLRTLRPEA